MPQSGGVMKKVKWAVKIALILIVLWARFYIGHDPIELISVAAFAALIVFEF